MGGDINGLIIYDILSRRDVMECELWSMIYTYYIAGSVPSVVYGITLNTQGEKQLEFLSFS
jgi:hypothetical protein